MNAFATRPVQMRAARSTFLTGRRSAGMQAAVPLVRQNGDFFVGVKLGISKPGGRERRALRRAGTPGTETENTDDSTEVTRCPRKSLKWCRWVASRPEPEKPHPHPLAARHESCGPDRAFRRSRASLGRAPRRPLCRLSRGSTSPPTSTHERPPSLLAGVVCGPSRLGLASDG